MPIILSLGYCLPVLIQCSNHCHYSCNQLQDGSNKVNKKIVFNHDEQDVPVETELNDESLKSKKQKLFNEDDEEDSKLDIDVDFKLNHQFEGKKGNKVCLL